MLSHNTPSLYSGLTDQKPHGGIDRVSEMQAAMRGHFSSFHIFRPTRVMKIKTVYDRNGSATEKSSLELCITWKSRDPEFIIESFENSGRVPSINDFNYMTENLNDEGYEWVFPEELCPFSSVVRDNVIFREFAGVEICSDRVCDKYLYEHKTSCGIWQGVAWLTQDNWSPVKITLWMVSADRDESGEHSVVSLYKTVNYTHHPRFGVVVSGVITDDDFLFRPEPAVEVGGWSQTVISYHDYVETD